MNIRVETQQSQIVKTGAKNSQSDGNISFAEILNETAAAKQQSITSEQVDYFRNKYLSDRVLQPDEAQSLLGELRQLVEIDESLTDALATASTEVQKAPAANGWSSDKFFKYTEILRSISVDAENNPNLMEALVNKSGYTWTNEWGQMGMLSNGQVVQLGPGINLNSKGNMQLSEQEIAALKEKYMKDGSFSAADARFFIGELSHYGAIDGQLAWDLIMGETFTRDFGQPRQANLLADEERWDLDALLEYLWQKHLDFKEKADAETDISLWKQYKHNAEQREKLHGIFQTMLET